MHSRSVKWVRFRDPEGNIAFGRLDEAGASASVEVFVGDMFADPQSNGIRLPFAELSLLAPVRPTKVIALWNNFYALAAKLGQPVPKEPLYLLKPQSSVIDPGGSFVRPPHYDGKVTYEGEIGIVIGRRSSRVSEADADAAIFGYTLVNDLTAQDILQRDPTFPQWARSKGFDTFCPIGPVVATGLDWKQLNVRTMVDGRERQNYLLADMIFNPLQLVALLSREMTLEPGDVIACGTSVGVLPVRPGSTVEIVAEGIGTLSNRYGESA